MGFKSFFTKKKEQNPSTEIPPQPQSVSLDSKQQRVQEIEQVFNRFDVNGDGKISSSELGAMLSTLGNIATEEELKRMVEEVDSDGDGFIDLEEFIKLNTIDSDQHLEDVKSAFTIMDANGDGLISAHELQKVLRSLGDKASIEECKKMINAVDCDGDGFISFEDFKKMMVRGSSSSQVPADEKKLI